MQLYIFIIIFIRSYLNDALCNYKAFIWLYYGIHVGWGRRLDEKVVYNLGNESPFMLHQGIF